MPTIPVFSPTDSGPIAARTADEEPYGRVELSPTALAFLIPLFVVFIFGPIACVVGIRRSRRNVPQTTVPFAVRQMAWRREEARRRLQGVTTVSNVADGTQAACVGEATEGEKAAESLSILERECAICLSPLHAPSPPEPAKLATGTAEVGEPSIAPSILEKGEGANEEILKLNVCGHEFHAECLISWFIRWKYSCPICRAVYYGKKPEEKKVTAGTQTESAESGGGPSEGTEQRRQEGGNPRRVTFAIPIGHLR